jgi:hypothetical protein
MPEPADTLLDYPIAQRFGLYRLGDDPLTSNWLVVVSRYERCLARAPGVVAAPVRFRPIIFLGDLPLGPDDGLPRDAVLETDTLLWIRKQDLGHLVGILAHRHHRRLRRALAAALGLRPP